MLWDGLRHDLRYTVRTLRRDSGFFGAALLIVGLGIGANTLIFSVVNTLLFRPLPFQAADRLVWIANTGKEGDLSSVTSRVANYRDWTRMNRSFEGLTAYFAFFDYGSYNLIGSGEPERLIGVGVAQNFLTLLGVKPELGRGFVAEECKWNGTPAVILSRDRSWSVYAHGVTYPPGQEPNAHPRLVDWRYLPTMRIPLIAGREFNQRDTAESDKVMIVNEKMARRLWPNQNPIGQIAMVSGDRRVVGVVGNVRHQALEKEGGLEVYLPITQASDSSVELVVRTKLPPKAVASGVRAALRSVEPALPTTEYQELGELVDRAVSPRRFMVFFLGAFALAALLLASVGIFGVVSYTVSQRTQEIGIRMALGASAAQVQRHVMTQTIVLVSAGIVAGVVGAVLLARLMAALLYDLAPTDPVTFVVTVVVLLAVAATAGYLPALRASRVDPMSALRTN